MRPTIRKEGPLVSIVIPAFNGAVYVGEAIESVLGQSYENVELIVLDDGSTDDTPNVVRRYHGKLYHERHANIGQAATLNRGWEIAEGDYLAYLSCDDALLRDAVGRSAEFLLRHREAVLSYCDYYLMNEESQVIRRVYTPEFSYWDLVVKGICAPGPGVFFRREGLNKSGLWDTTLRQTPDYDYWLRLGLHGTFVRIPEPLAKFRVHGKSQSFAETDIARSEEIIRVMHRYFEMEGIPEDVLVARMQALSNAHILAARLHLRAGRYRFVIRNLVIAMRLHALSFFSFRTYKVLGNGVLYRLKKSVFGMWGR
jgi:glycosyltransferase involved in cell wall biosynthesis